MVANNFDDESIQICLCGHLGCGGSDTIEECALLNYTSDECNCVECNCDECDNDECCVECNCIANEK